MEWLSLDLLFEKLHRQLKSPDFVKTHNTIYTMFSSDMLYVIPIVILNKVNYVCCDI